MVILTKFKVTIPYFDSGTKKEHTIDFFVTATDEAEAVKLARERFEMYEKLSQASWLRIIRDGGIVVTEVMSDAKNGAHPHLK